MPAKTMKAKKWSYSRWSMYHACPSQYEYHYILGNKRPRSYALDRGIDIDNKANRFIDGSITGLPKELNKFRSEFMNLKRLYNNGAGFSQYDLSFNEDKSRPKNMFESNYYMGIADYTCFDEDVEYDDCEEVDSIDYKSGKWYASHEGQGHAYCTATFTLFPEAERTSIEFWYLDSGETTEFTYERSQYKFMLALWEKRINKMYADKVFKKTPHQYCYNCCRNVKNGGDCSG